MYATIVPFSQSFDDIGFMYHIPEFLQGTIQIGMIVIVPFGKKHIFGMVINISGEILFDETKIKDIVQIYGENIFLNPTQIQLLKWIANQYFCCIHHSLRLFFPQNLREKILKQKFLFKNQFPNFEYTFQTSKSLNRKQQEIFETILESNQMKYLLFGVTGSGKTEIYIHLIKQYLDIGKQSLLLVPEIILTDQISTRIKNVFGANVVVLNSTISEAKKTLLWESIYHGQAKIVVGTRTALFYPYKNLGLIIVDEAHDQSYISDITPRYDGIEIANQISQLQETKLILGSGTPKINHMYDAICGKYVLLQLFDEFVYT